MLCLTLSVPAPWVQDFLSFPYPPQFSQRTQVTLDDIVGKEGEQRAACCGSV